MAQEEKDRTSDTQKRDMLKHLAHIRARMAPSGNLRDSAMASAFGRIRSKVLRIATTI